MKRNRKTARLTAAGIADAMIAHGATFRFTPGQFGTLRVGGLSLLPPPLVQLFFGCDVAQLAAYLRAKLASKEGSLNA